MLASSPENIIQAAADRRRDRPPEITTCVYFFDFDSEALRARSAPGNKNGKLLMSRTVTETGTGSGSSTSYK